MPFTPEQIEKDLKWAIDAHGVFSRDYSIGYIRECQRLMELNQKLIDALKLAQYTLNCPIHNLNDGAWEAWMMHNRTPTIRAIDEALTPASDGKESK